jgi:hypothetical protein
LACAEGRLAGGCLAALAVIALAGCAALPAEPAGAHPFPGVPRERDLRAAYRAAACERIGGGEASCERVLLREPAEPTTAAPPARGEDARGRYRIGLVPGLFAECLAPIVRAFGDVEPGLRERGYEVLSFDVPGRGTAEANARYLADHLGKAAGDARPFILVTYSKGLTDVLEYLVRYPGSRPRVAAVISIAGAAHGSPLADAHQSLYRDWLARLPMPGCAASDGSEILDLSREARSRWWALHGSDVRTPIFGLVTTPREDRLSFGLRTAHARLAEIDPRNDGKLLWYDQLVPGGWLLGFLNADHWAVATPLDTSLPALSFLFRDDLPRLALVEAAIVVAADVLAREYAR